ncbi:MAG: DUF2271 domain-containing protein [Chitinispirillaceae bacterium]|jgi:hypothetical protein|nr:DUF2271 domain-containing protein [Chitinispirillaceae bacterium]
MKRAAVSTAMGVLFYLMVGSAPASADSLSGVFTTINNSGKTYIVVYVINQAGAFVKTLRVWGVATKSGYWSQMKVWPSLSSKSIVDAVTGATCNGNLTNQTYSWNGKNVSGAAMPNGNYSLVIESVRENNNYRILKAPFVFDGTNKKVSPANATIFTNVSFNIFGSSPANRAPVITSAAAVTCTSGTTKTYVATATDADANALTFTFSGLPAWITASGATLTMKPVSTSVNNTVTIIAADGKGGLDTLSLAVTVVKLTHIAKHEANGQQAFFTLGNTRMQLPVNAQGPVSFTVLSLNGKEIVSRTLTAPAGENKIVMPVQKLPAGNYFVKIQNKSFSNQQRIFLGR